MNKKRFILFSILGPILFFTRIELAPFIEQVTTNGFHQFLLTGVFLVPAFFLFFSAIGSLFASGAYLIVRGDPELKVMARNMFYFFIWKELLDES